MQATAVRCCVCPSKNFIFQLSSTFRRQRVGRRLVNCLLSLGTVLFQLVIKRAVEALKNLDAPFFHQFFQCVRNLGDGDLRILPFHPELGDALDGVCRVGILFKIGEDQFFDGFSFPEYQLDLPLQ